MKSISNKIRVGLALTMLFTMIGIFNVGAQGGLTYTSGVQVVNLESTDAQDVDITYYNPDGSVAGTLLDETIAGNSSKTYYPLIGVDPPFKGSMVITADREIAAIANLVTPDYNYTASSTGFTQGGTEFSLPLIMCNNSGFNTFFSVQNTSLSSDAHVTITYYPGSHGASGVSESATIPPGAAASFDQAVGSLTKDCDDLKGLSTKFIGSAKITSTDQPVVATVMQLSTTGFAALMGYNGFASGSPIVSLPLIMANNNGFYTGVQIQNIGDATTEVTLDYSPNTAGAFNPDSEVFSLDPGEAKTIIQNDAPPANGSVNTFSGMGKYIGAATVTNTGNKPLVAIVNQVVPAGSFGPFGSAYEGFNPAAATANVATPLIMANNSGFYTGIQVYNVGANCPSVTIDYGANVAPGGTFDPANEVFSLNAGLSKTIIQNDAPPANGSTVNTWTGVGKYIGSADISAPGCSIVAMVNEVAITSGDRLMTYDGINH